MSFKSLGLSEEIIRAVQKMGYKEPFKIQTEAIPVILSGSNVIALAKTGSGKTAAFVLPILQKLLNQKKVRNIISVLILVPTRELALQVDETFQKIGTSFGLRTVRENEFETYLVAGSLKLRFQIMILFRYSTIHLICTEFIGINRMRLSMCFDVLLPERKGWKNAFMFTKNQLFDFSGGIIDCGEETTFRRTVFKPFFIRTIVLQHLTFSGSSNPPCTMRARGFCRFLFPETNTDLNRADRFRIPINPVFLAKFFGRKGGTEVMIFFCEELLDFLLLIFRHCSIAALARVAVDERLRTMEFYFLFQPPDMADTELEELCGSCPVDFLIDKLLQNTVIIDLFLRHKDVVGHRMCPYGMDNILAD